MMAEKGLARMKGFGWWDSREGMVAECSRQKKELGIKTDT